MKRMVFRLAPDLRRCCWYCFGMFAAVIAIAFWMHSTLERNPPPVIAFVLLSIPGLMAVYFLSWRLELSEEGLSTSSLFHSMQWPWSLFSTGRVEKHGTDLVCLELSFWKRRIRTGLVDKKSLPRIFEVVNRNFRLTESPALHSEVVFKRGMSCTYRFDSRGVETETISAGEKKNEFVSWHEIESVEFDRLEPLRHEFKTLIVDTGRERIRFSRNDKPLQWSRKIRVQLSLMIEQNFSADRPLVNIMGEPFRNPRRIEDEIRKQEKSSRESLYIVLLPTVLFSPLIFVDGLAAWASFALPHLVLFLPIVFLVRYTARKRIKELEQMQEQLQRRTIRGYEPPFPPRCYSGTAGLFSPPKRRSLEAKSRIA